MRAEKEQAVRVAAEEDAMCAAEYKKLAACTGAEEAAADMK